MRMTLDNKFKNNKWLDLLVKSKPSIVRVLRYFREWDDDNWQVSSSGGMTAICILDYPNKKITVYPTFCVKGDNFNKELGLKYAEESEKENLGFTVSMNKEHSIYGNIVRGTYDSINWIDSESEHILKTPLRKWLCATHANDFL